MNNTEANKKLFRILMELLSIEVELDKLMEELRGDTSDPLSLQLSATVEASYLLDPTLFLKARCNLSEVMEFIAEKDREEKDREEKAELKK